MCKENLYYIIETEEEVDGIKYTGYGVACRKNDVPAVYNLSENKEKVEELINIINDNQLNPIQLYEVCEDSLI